MKNANVVPAYYNQGNPRNPNLPQRRKQIVFWNNEYTRPLAVAEQKVGETNFAASRLKKRNTIKEKLDKEDPALVNELPEDDQFRFGFRGPIWFERKKRREALQRNPFQNMSSVDRLGNAYRTPTLKNNQVSRNKWIDALKTYADYRESPRMAPSPGYEPSTPNPTPPPPRRQPSPAAAPDLQDMSGQQPPSARVVPAVSAARSQSASASRPQSRQPPAQSRQQPGQSRPAFRAPLSGNRPPPASQALSGIQRPGQLMSFQNPSGFI
jgi:hypothetical protein